MKQQNILFLTNLSTRQTNNQQIIKITILATFVRELNDNSLEPLLDELDKKPKSYAVYYNRTKVDWKEIYGIAVRRYPKDEG